MRYAACLPVILLSLHGAAPAQTPAPSVEGVYADQVFEVGSTLLLSPTGRFFWVFSMGALDLAAQGRWTQAADGAVVLASDPGIVAPRFELVARSRDDRPGTFVRLVCETGDASHFLGALFEYAGGENILHRFDRFEARADDEPTQRVTAVRVASESFDLLSVRFPVDDSANVFTFRFIPGDLGFVDFRDQRVEVAGNRLTLNWRGMPLNYVREGSAAGVEVPTLPRPPAPEPAAAPAVVEVRVGETVEALQAREGMELPFVPELGSIRAFGPVDLRLGFGDSTLDVGRIDAAGAFPLVVRDDNSRTAVTDVSFPYQDGPLTLEEALVRARSLRTWLEQAGFAAAPDSAGPETVPQFMIGPYSGEGTPHADDWDSAARMLGDESQGILDMQLYNLSAGERHVNVTIYNSRRQAQQTCPHADSSPARWKIPGAGWPCRARIC